MSYSISQSCNTQKELLTENLFEFYKNPANLQKMIRIINGESKISLRIVDWFVTNYAKKNFTFYDISKPTSNESSIRFKVFHEYKLQLKAYSKKVFDPFARWERISMPIGNNMYMETTLGQLNFFKWAIDNLIIEYIQEHYDLIESDMNNRNSTSRKKEVIDNATTRKKREELSISACKCIKKENVKIIIKFS